MDLESLTKGDIIFITNISGDRHKADFMEFTDDGVYVNFQGFGQLEMKWKDITSIEQVMQEHKNGNSYGPRYKVFLWKNQ